MLSSRRILYSHQSPARDFQHFNTSKLQRQACNPCKLQCTSHSQTSLNNEPGNSGPVLPPLANPSRSTQASECSSSSRRSLLATPLASLSAAFVVAIAGGMAYTSPASAIPLAPLGRTKRVGGDKRTGMSVNQIKVGEHNIDSGKLSMAHICVGLLPPSSDLQCHLSTYGFKS